MKPRDSERAFFLSGKNVVLSPYSEEAHLTQCWRWINDPEVRRYLNNDKPISLEHERELLRDLTENPAENLFLIIETKRERTPIGTIGLHNINWTNRRAMGGTMIGEDGYWGKGYGTDAKFALLYHAFCTLGFEKVCSSVLAFNGRSLNYLKHTGHREEGRRERQFYRGGVWIDEILLAVFKEDFLPLWEAYDGKPIIPKKEAINAL